MKQKNQTLSSKKILYIGIPAILLLIAVRFFTAYILSDGFSGISKSIPLFIAGFFIFALLTYGCFASWVYEDCKKRNDDPILWIIILFITTPYIGIILYFIRRPDVKKTCEQCGYKASIKANYCEQCGSPLNHIKEETIMKNNIHLKIIGGIICTILMLTCLTGFVISAATKGNINTSISSGEKIWNTGAIIMSVETNWKGVWKLSFKSASDGFIKESRLKISDSQTNILHADITCGTIPENGNLTLWLVQGETAKSFDVTNLGEPLEYPLSEFENGKVYVRLQINGVKDVKSEISIK